MNQFIEINIQLPKKQMLENLKSKRCKPTFLIKKSQINDKKRYILCVLFFFLIAIILLAGRPILMAPAFSIVINKINKYVQRQACRVASEMVVCSHWGNSTELKGVKVGSLSSLKELWVKGVTCFDISVSETADEALIATHESVIQNELKLNGSLDNIKLNELRQIYNADEELYPTLDMKMTLFAQLLSEMTSYTPILKGDKYHLVHSPFITIQLVGPAINPGAIRHILNLVRDLHLQGHVILWFSLNEEYYEVIRDAKANFNVFSSAMIPEYKFGKGGNLVQNNPFLDKEARKVFDFLGPSIELDATWFREYKQVYRKPMISWLVSDKKDMIKGISEGVDVIITDYPFRQKAFIEDFLDENCRK